MPQEVELIDLCDDKNVLTGKTASRDEVHAQGLWHRTVHIYLTCEDAGVRELLIHRRAASKKQYPGLLDPVFGGHVQSGSTEIEAVLQELEEELGFVPDIARLTYHGYTKKDDELNAPNDREFNMIYRYQINGDELLTPNSAEIESIQWIPLEELRSRQKENPHDWRPSTEEIERGIKVLETPAEIDFR